MTNNYQQTRVITSISDGDDWYTISTDGLCFGLKKKYGVKPEVGDSLTVHTKGNRFGQIRGMALNNSLIFWKTDEEMENHRKEELEKMAREKVERFEREKDKMDADYNSLTEPFKRRIDRFRANNPNFRVDYEAYELFCCIEALKIAKACKTAANVEEFSKLNNWELQAAMVEGLSREHSGNTFGCSVKLAYLYLTDHEHVVKMYGSMSPLVGAKEFGDIPQSDCREA